MFLLLTQIKNGQIILQELLKMLFFEDKISNLKSETIISDGDGQKSGEVASRD